MEENKEGLLVTDASGGNKELDNTIEDDTEDYILPTQPLSGQKPDMESTTKITPDDDKGPDATVSQICDSQIDVKTEMITPGGDTSRDFIPGSEMMTKRKIAEEESPTEDSCKRRLSLDDSGIIKNSQDIFSSQGQLNDTIDAAQIKVPESPDLSLVPESPSCINETIESESSDANISNNQKCVLDETQVDTSIGDATHDSIKLPPFDASESEKPVAEPTVTPSDKSKSGGDEGENVPNSSPRCLENSEMTPEIPPDKVEESAKGKPLDTELDETIDANEIEIFDNPYSSEETDVDGGYVNTVPSMTDDHSSPLDGDIEMVGKAAPKGSRLKGVLKSISDEEAARLQKHSTPENPLSKSLKINESTSSIENGTPPVQEDKSQISEIRFDVFLQVNCQVEIDLISKQPVSKKVLHVKEMVPRHQKHEFQEPCSDSSYKTKRLSSSSSGSVYSDKTGLPYPLPSRPSAASVATERSSGSSLDLAKRIQIVERKTWINEYMLPTAIDDLVPRYVEQYLKAAEGGDGRRRKSSMRTKKKSHWHQPLDNVLESSITEPSSDNNTDVLCPSLDKSDASKPVDSLLEDKPKTDDPPGEVEERYAGEKAVDKAEKSGAVEVKEKEEAPEDEPNDEMETNGTLIEGALVFARWTDKRYYPGKLKNKAKYDRWEVAFDDETEKVIREDFILPLGWLGKGELVFALVGDKYVSGKISAIVKEKKELNFRIELDDGHNEIVVKKSDLCLNDVMAGIIREKFKPANKGNAPVKTATGIDFDNVVIGKRVREQRTPISGPSALTQPGSSTLKKKRNAAMKVTEEDGRTPKTKATPHSRKELQSDEVSSSRKKSTKLTTRKDRGGSPSEETPLRLAAKSDGPKRRARALNYDSERASASSATSRESEESEDFRAASRVNRKKRGGPAKGLLTDFEKAVEEPSKKASAPGEKRKAEEETADEAQRRNTPSKQRRMAKARGGDKSPHGKGSRASSRKASSDSQEGRKKGKNS